MKQTPIAIILGMAQLLAVFPTAFAQLHADSQQFVRADAPVVALTHVRIIDGTGAEPLEESNDHHRRWKDHGHITQQQPS